MNKLIEAELKEMTDSLHGDVERGHLPRHTIDGALHKAFALGSQARSEDILSKLPAEKGGMKRGSYDCCVNSPECECLGWDSCLSQVKNIIKPKDV